MSDSTDKTPDIETRISRLELAIFGDPSLRMDGIQDKLDRLEQHARAQDEHNRKQEAASARQKWIGFGVVLGLGVQGVSLVSLIRLAATIASGAP